MKLCKLEFWQIEKLLEGKLTWITHPKRGVCKAYSNKVYVVCEEITEDDILEHPFLQPISLKNK